MNYTPLYDQLKAAGFIDWVRQLRHQESGWLINHGDYSRWQRAISDLPPIENLKPDFNRSAVTLDGQCKQTTRLRNALMGLSPWRKGPFQIGDVYIDTEWRSDFKWSRVLPHLSPLSGRKLLDVGCGNGYHCWRMLAENPRLVLGVEPSVLFNLQFRALEHYLRRPEICLLPIGVESMPGDLNWFDTVFSMGVLYHRRSPIDHIYQLKSFLRPGGELCLETLVIDGNAGEVLVPDGRYARMHNTWFIPSAIELSRWLLRCGFGNIRVADISVTTVEEQRSTEWMQFESLEQCLDPENPDSTLEGLPAPRRATLIAEKTA